MIVGQLVSYNKRTREATVQVIGRGRITAMNYLQAGRPGAKSIVNPLLSAQEQNTVIPQEHFSAGQEVALYSTGNHWWLLGTFDAAPVENETVLVALNPGEISLEQTIEVGETGLYEIPQFAHRALIHRVDIVPPNASSYFVRIGTVDNPQAVWGTGDVQLTGTLRDHAGFGFQSPDGKLRLQLPAGEYHIRIQGERFA